MIYTLWFLSHFNLRETIKNKGIGVIRYIKSEKRILNFTNYNDKDF